MANVKVPARTEHAIDGHSAVHRFAVPVRKCRCFVDHKAASGVKLLESGFGEPVDGKSRHGGVDQRAIGATESKHIVAVYAFIEKLYTKATFMHQVVVVGALCRARHNE